MRRNTAYQYALLTCEGDCRGDRAHACRGWTDCGDGRWECEFCDTMREGPDPRDITKEGTPA